MLERVASKTAVRTMDQNSRSVLVRHKLTSRKGSSALFSSRRKQWAGAEAAHCAYSSLHQLGSVTERAVFDAQQLHLIAGHSKVSIDRGEDVSVKPQPSKALEASSRGKAAKHMCGSHVAGYLKVQGGIWRHLPNTLLAIGELWRDDKLPLTPDSHAPHTLD